MESIRNTDGNANFLSINIAYCRMNTIKLKKLFIIFLDEH